jgi:DNA (cytosine-5)-methyltransferase 1
MKFIDMFAGMGTVRMGFERAGHECVSAIEFDPHKRKIYEVIFGHEPEFGDITAVRGTDLPSADCWCFGAPCQDFSLAGMREGLEGDRSSLIREVFRLVRETPQELRPEWLLYENVKGMLSSGPERRRKLKGEKRWNGFDFLEILFEMASLGYDIQYELLNSKDFGVPQNRERVYTLGHLRRYGKRKIFPIGIPDKRTDISVYGYTKESSVKDRTRILNTYGVSQCLRSTDYKDPPKIAELKVRQIGNVMPTTIRSNPNQGRVYDTRGIAPCLNKMEGGGREPLITEPCACLTPDRLEKRQNGRRFKEPGEPMFTLTKQDIHGIKQNSRIRRLTPRECMRLQGVPDCITDKLISAGISDTQMYRAAGDACTVNVIYEIARRL